MVYFGSVRDEVTQATVLVGGCSRRGLQRQPDLWLGAALMMQVSFGTCQRLEKHMASCAHLAACSSSGRLPWLPLCLRRTVLLLATNGSLECVMGMGLSPN